MSKKITTADFVERSISKYGPAAFGYEHAAYTKAKDLITLVCRNCGRKFETTPDYHFQKRAAKLPGCPECALAYGHRSMRKTTAEYVAEARLVHGDAYRYPNTVYELAKNLVEIECPAHGSFWQEADSHLQGRGCDVCAWLKRAAKLRNPLVDCLARMDDLYKGKITCLNMSETLNLKDNREFLCADHGQFTRSFHHLLDREQGCGLYADERLRELYAMGYDEFVRRATIVHSNGYNYPAAANYKNNRTKVLITCRTHGPFLQNPYDHLSGRGCSQCNRNTSKVETEWLDWLGVCSEPGTRQKFLRLEGSGIKVDGYDGATNTVYEFWGDYWHGNPKFYDQGKMHPKIKLTFGQLYKRTLAKIEKIKCAGFQLVEIWEDDWKKLKKELKNGP